MEAGYFEVFQCRQIVTGMTGDSGADVVCFTDAMSGIVFAGVTRAAGYPEDYPALDPE